AASRGSNASCWASTRPGITTSSSARWCMPAASLVNHWSRGTAPSGACADLRAVRRARGTGILGEVSLPAVWLLGLVACGAVQAGTACTTPPPGQAQLRPTLELRQADGGPVVFEQGRPVPTFSAQPRDGIDLDGAWRFQPATLDPGLTFASRD